MKTAATVHYKNSEKGQALALFGSTLAGLALLLGLVVPPAQAYASQEKLQQAVEAPGLDIVLIVDASESMAWYSADHTKLPMGTPMRDPKLCNEADAGGADGYKGDCHPFQEIKAAAITFSKQLHFPYDRLSIVTFHQTAMVQAPLSDDPLAIEAAVQGLEIYEGMGRCMYDSDDPSINFANPADQSPVPPFPYSGPDEIRAACRLLDTSGTNFYGMVCPLFYGPNPSLELCGNTNPGAGFVAAANILAGVYPPAARDGARKVVILLSDGAPNSAFKVDGTPICPASTQTYAWVSSGGPPCRDKDSSEASRHGATSALYDPDDYARDMIDLVAATGTLIYSIGMPGSELLNPNWTGDPPTQALLQYAAAKGGGNYHHAASAAELNAIFLEIHHQLTAVATSTSPRTPNPTRASDSQSTAPAPSATPTPALSPAVSTMILLACISFIIILLGILILVMREKKI